MIALLACLRGWDVRQYQKCRARILDSAAAAKRERRYVAGAAAHVLLLGMWCLVAFSKTSNPFVQIFSFALTLAYMIGISGCNFASNLLVLAQIICAGVPMTAALLLVGGWYYAVFAFVLVPFFASLKFISDRLRRVLLDAVIAGRDVAGSRPVSIPPSTTCRTACAWSMPKGRSSSAIGGCANCSVCPTT